LIKRCRLGAKKGNEKKEGFVLQGGFEGKSACQDMSMLLNLRGESQEKRIHDPGRPWRKAESSFFKKTRRKGVTGPSGREKGESRELDSPGQGG